MKQTIAPRWLTRKGAKQYTGLALSTIDLHIKAKRFKTHLAGGRRLIDRISLDTWIGAGEPLFDLVRLHPDDIEAIAVAVVRNLRLTHLASDPKAR
jgi:hypothetical protein